VIQYLYDNEFFLKDKKAQKAWDVLNRKNYLEGGSYRLSMRVKTSNPNKIFNAEWSFQLNEEESQLLRLNSIATIREVCFGKAIYFFAYLRYNIHLEQPNKRVQADTV
jgi:hypothetical protein